MSNHTTIWRRTWVGATPSIQKLGGLDTSLQIISHNDDIYHRTSVCDAFKLQLSHLRVRRSPVVDLHAVLSENRLNGCQIFGRFGFVKTESEQNFGFPHIPSYLQTRALSVVERIDETAVVWRRQRLTVIYVVVIVTDNLTGGRGRFAQRVWCLYTVVSQCAGLLYGICCAVIGRIASLHRELGLTVGYNGDVTSQRLTINEPSTWAATQAAGINQVTATLSTGPRGQCVHFWVLPSG